MSSRLNAIFVLTRKETHAHTLGIADLMPSRHVHAQVENPNVPSCTDSRCIDGLFYGRWKRECGRRTCLTTLVIARSLSLPGCLPTLSSTGSLPPAVFPRSVLRLSQFSSLPGDGGKGRLDLNFTIGHETATVPPLRFIAEIARAFANAASRRETLSRTRKTRSNDSHCSHSSEFRAFPRRGYANFFFSQTEFFAVSNAIFIIELHASMV